MLRGDRLVAEPEPLHRPGPEVLDDDVGAREQRVEDARARGCLRSSARLSLLRLTLRK